LSGGTIVGAVALSVVLFVLLLALVGPYVAPHTSTEIVGPPFAARASGRLLGTDFLGRDVLSRVLHGGRSVVFLATISVLGSYALGATIGLVAGFREGAIDAWLMRTVDVLLAFPPILFLLVFAAGLGASAWALVLAIAIIFAPSVARVIRAATQATAHSGYVEAAQARGESTTYIVFREILPNIRSTIVADAGPRLTFAILLVAAVNYLGLGLRPPAADWALMISENRGGLGLQPWALAVPAGLIAVLTVAVNVVADQVSNRARDLEVVESVEPVQERPRAFEDVA
jgi:ABC-type dipeptide/oligopeptide/nickel transport system permease subunit